VDGHDESEKVEIFEGSAVRRLGEREIFQWAFEGEGGSTKMRGDGGEGIVSLACKEWRVKDGVLLNEMLERGMNGRCYGINMGKLAGSGLRAHTIFVCVWFEG
jgi:hypothetical protein